MAKVRKDKRGRNLHKGEYQRSDGRYAYAYRYNGKRVFIYDTDLASLRKKEQQIQADLIDGIRTYESSRLTLNDLFQVYMETKTNLKESTESNYRYLWEHYIQHESIAEKALSKIHKSDVKLLYAKLLQEGFASNSLESINNLIHPVLELAVDDDLIRKNPSNGVYREMKTNAPVQRIALTSEQAKHFLQYIESSPQYCSWLPLFVTLLGTGMRASECTGLVWDDIDFENNCIHVDHALIYRSIHGNAQWYISTLKTRNSVRTIPMISAVAQQLTLLYEKNLGKHAKPGPTLDGYHGFVFLNRFGQLINAHGIDRAIERIRTSYNDVESTRAKEYDRKPELLPHFTAHCLRHTFCTRLCECEKDLAVIQHLMGHSDIETTLTVYDHVSPNRLRKAMNSLDQAYVFGLL